MDEGTDRSSRARDHMANERTHLAWLRTAANVVVVGLAVARFADNGTTSPAGIAAGGVLILAGAAGIVYGTVRYRAVNKALEDGQFVSGGGLRGMTWSAVVLLAVLTIATTLLLTAV